MHSWMEAPENGWNGNTFGSTRMDTPNLFVFQYTQNGPDVLVKHLPHSNPTNTGVSRASPVGGCPRPKPSPLVGKPCPRHTSANSHWAAGVLRPRLRMRRGLRMVSKTGTALSTRLWCTTVSFRMPTWCRCAEASPPAGVCPNAFWGDPFFFHRLVTMSSAGKKARSCGKPRSRTVGTSKGASRGSGSTTTISHVLGREYSIAIICPPKCHRQPR